MKIVKNIFEPLEIKSGGVTAFFRPLYWYDDGADEIAVHFRGGDGPANDGHRLCVKLFKEWLEKGLVGKPLKKTIDWIEEREFEFRGDVDEVKAWIAKNRI